MSSGRSAGLFVTGAWLAIGGSALGCVGIASMSTSSASIYSSGPDGFSVFLTLLSAAAAVIGSILIAIALYRALAKIDALVALPARPQAQQWQGQYPQPPQTFPWR